ncbi:uncharacterized protein TNIN_383241 [Trichonephila inaurata madagascariensis]|uniref:Uncharacterized protein n=1 Tax=Trichonephila inaurata madagascariensis TaxID=2747483 RepID=A0A8X6WXP8_9ARAC|nr:uncharacterized protein TNIN_383241 [Trichonephila inaurata madagascariensis]
MQTHLKDKYLRLETVQESVSGVQLQKDDDGTKYEADFSEAEEYREDYLSLSTLVDKKLEESVIVEEQDIPRKFRLPKLELKKFDGDAKDYLSFWSQFQKIHDDRSIPEEDKMQYLIASVEPNSKAERLVQSFPATTSNYAEAVAQLKERFGREDLLVQIYVRDLLTMVMKNAVSGRARTDLAKTLRRIGGKAESTGEPWKNAGEIWRFPGPPSRKLSAGRDPVDMGAHQKSSRTL